MECLAQSKKGYQIKNYSDLSNMSKADLKRQDFFYLAQGSSRSVFDLNNGMVVKVAKRLPRGYAQNMVESELYAKIDEQYKHWLCPIHYADERIVVMDKALPLNKGIPKEKRLFVRDFKRTLNICADIFRRDEFSRPINRFNEDIIESVKSSDIFKFISTVTKTYGILWGDTCRPSSWGLLGDHIVLLDYGCSKEVYETHYKRKYAA